MSSLFCNGRDLGRELRQVGRLSTDSREQRIAELEDALRPFAHTPGDWDYSGLSDDAVVHMPRTVGDIRRAKSALNASSHNPPHIGPREGNRPAYRPPMTHGGAAGSRGGAPDVERGEDA